MLITDTTLHAHTNIFREYLGQFGKILSIFSIPIFYNIYGNMGYGNLSHNSEIKSNHLMYT